MEIGRWNEFEARSTPRLRWLVPVLAIVCMSAGFLTWWQRGQVDWRFPTKEARALLASGTDEQRRAAVVALSRDVHETIAALASAAEAETETGAQARIALQRLAERARTLR